MNKRKAIASNAISTIRKPAPEKTIKEFVLTKEECNAHKIDQLYEDLPTTMWSGLNNLIDQLINIYYDTLDSTTAFNNSLQSLELIRNKRSNNKKLCHYVSKCTEYLKQHRKPTLPVSWLRRSMNPKMKVLK